MTAQSHDDAAGLLARLRPFEHPSTTRSLWQVANSALPYAALWYAMLQSLSWSYLATLALAVPAAGFLLRVFIIQHDCGHGSFLPGRAWNDRVGRLCSVLTFTPYLYWRRFHATHHATSGKLHERAEFDVPTLTVREYRALPPLRRLAYRVVRHPLVLFGVGSVLHFVLRQRLPWLAPRHRVSERRSILLTDVALLGLYGALAARLGIADVLLLLAPILTIASAAGMWLFYVQHQFEETYWAGRDDWTFVHAGLQGSSYYRLPPVLQWFTGNIGLHHVHHLSVRIPNYRLQECLESDPLFTHVPTLTLRDGWRTARLKLWDEERQRLVSFADAPHA